MISASTEEREPVMASIRRPNLFLIGAMKSGTTYLTKLLGEHPSIFMVTLSEPSYFVPQEYLRKYWLDQWKERLWEDESRYLELFAGTGDEVHVGEGSTNYAKRPMIPGVPEAISRFNPDSRFVYLLRDPVKRTISHYWHNVRYHSENRPMLEAFQKDEEYLSVSHYALQLRPYQEIFGLDRVSVLTFEDLIESPETTLATLFRALGVDDSFVPPGLDEPENPTPPVVEKAKGMGLLQRLRRSEGWDKISPLIPRRIRAVGTRMAEAEVKIASVPVEEVAAFLRPILAEQTEELSSVLGRTFPQWKTLHGST